MDNQRDWKKHTTPNSKYKYLGEFSKSKQGSRTNRETKKAYFGEKSSGLSQFYQIWLVIPHMQFYVPVTTEMKLPKQEPNGKTCF